MIRINITLLEKLFAEPNPQPDNPEVLNIYHKLFYRMFPGKNSFVEFLQVQNYDKQYSLAEEIIHRLCYTSNFPPSFFAIKDVISVENYQKETVSAADSYVPRDHFIHLVHLYMLGIYVFFYNPLFYNKILLDNRFERHSEQHCQPKLDSVKDFISEWKYFCLFHDVGYVPEIFGNEKFVANATKTYSTLCKRPNDFQSSLAENKPIKQITFFGALEIMSRIFMAKFIIDYSTTEIIKSSKLFRLFRKSELSMYTECKRTGSIDFEKEFIPFFTKTFSLEKIYSNHCIKPLLPILGECNVIVLGVHKETGELSFISFVKDEIRSLLVLTKYESSNDILRLAQDPSLVLFDDFKPLDFELEYLLKEDSLFQDLYDMILFNDDSFVEYSYELVKATLGIRFASISCEEQFLNFYFDIYMFLYSTIRKYTFPKNNSKQITQAKNFETFLDKWSFSFNNDDPTTLNKLAKLSDIVYSLIQCLYTENIKEKCIECIENIDIESSKPKASRALNPEILISDFVDNYFSAIKEKVESDDEKASLKVSIKDTYCQQIEQTSSLIKMYAIINSGLKSILKKCSDPFSYVFDYEKLSETFNDSFTESIIQEKTKAILKRSFQDFITNYDIPFNNKFNHGFASFKYAAGIFEILRNSIEIKKTPQEWKLIDILFSISSQSKNTNYITQYITNYNHIFKNVLYAILIHDVYPANFTKGSKLRKMQTTISDPFSYLALLCDALQQWNRPQSISASLLDAKYSEHASEEYNIIVKNDGIYLYEESIEKSQRRLAESLANMSHLADIEAFLKNGYTI